MLSALVLAAGLGSRLHPLTAIRPKALAPLGDRPALAHVLDPLEQAGVTRVVVNTHHGAEAMARFIASRPGVAVSHEPDLLGTAGGLAAAATLLGSGDVLVWNADIFVALDPAVLVGAHAAGSPREATLVVQKRAPGQGTVGLASTGRVVRLRDERVASAVDEASGAEFLGVHVVGAHLRARLPARGCLVGDLYIPALREGARLQAFAWGEPFFDIGSLGAYVEANLAWLRARGVSRWVAEGAHVARGIVLEQTVVGEGATVTGRAGDVLERCVVWPGASVEAPLSDAVVVPGAIVRVAPHARASSSP